MSEPWRTTLDLFLAQPPQAVQGALERATDTVFSLDADAAPPACAACFDSVGLSYRLALLFVDARARGNGYRLQVEVEPGPGWTDLASAHRSAQGWIGVWTADLSRQSQAPSGPAQPARHRELTEAWRAEEAGFAQPAHTQRRILDAMRAGQCFFTAHKEGGTTIRHTGRAFLSTDYGESVDSRRFEDEGAFLAYLRQFYDFQTSRHVWPRKVSEADAWRLIYRQLQPASG